MVNVMVTRHTRNDVILVDFHDPKTGYPVTVIMAAPNRIIFYSKKWDHAENEVWVPAKITKDKLGAVLMAISAYVDDDVQMVEK